MKKKEFTLAIVSAKGGVGKTMLTMSLIDLFNQSGFKINALDCDVNAPNLAIWLGVTKWDRKIPIKIFPLPNKYENCQPIKVICGHKIFMIKHDKRGEVKIRQNFKPKLMAHKINLISGDIKKGKTGSGKVVEETLAIAKKYKGQINIIDSAPGTGYPVLAPLKNSDYIIIITEPSILGLIDTKKLFLIAKEYNKKIGIVINKWNLNPKIGQKIKNWAHQNYLGKIDFEPQIEQNLNKRISPLAIKNNATKQLTNIYHSILRKNKISKSDNSF